MACILSIFTIIGFITTCAVFYLIAVDQWGIYQITKRDKNLEKEKNVRNKSK